MSSAARWSIVVIVVVAALAAALWGTLDASRGGGSDGDAAGQGGTGTSGVTPGPYRPASAQQRADAGIAACPGEPAAGAGGGSAGGAGTGERAAGDADLADLPLVCMADGADGTFAELAGGAPTLVNLWAYWCEPCRKELPALAEAQRRLGDAARVVLVHSDPAEGKGLDMLADLGVRGLPSLEDADGSVAAAAGAPPVLPVSVLVRADGTVAKVLPQVMDSADAAVAAVEENLGVHATTAATEPGSGR